MHAHFGSALCPMWYYAVPMQYLGIPTAASHVFYMVLNMLNCTLL